MIEKIVRAAQERVDAAYRNGSKDLSLIADPHVQTTAGGTSIVRFQQHYAGIPVFGGDLSVQVGSRGVRIAGELPEFRASGDGTPDLPALDAVMEALDHFRRKSDPSICQVIHPSIRGKAIPVVATLASFPFPSRPTVFRVARTLSSPAAHLTYHVAHGAGRLAWVVRTPFRDQTYVLLIAAEGEDKGRVILCTRWSAGAQCFATVFAFNHAAGRKRVPLPTAAADFPPLLSHPNSAFLGPWVDADQMAGNNVSTYDGNKQNALRAALAGGVLEFSQYGEKSKEQTLLNAFFYCNYLHDFFLMLGFGEAEGNFQLKNFAWPKGGNDRLEVRVFQKKHPNLADMDARDDSKAARLSLGLAPNNEPSGLHAELVIHEYTHGVVHRMVGGRLGALWLIQPQSLAMDEGWADYFAITLRNRYLGANPNYGFADWAGKPDVRSASYAPGVNRDYGQLKPPVTHAGETFAAALIRFNEFLGSKLNDAEKGHCIGWRAVIESLRLIPPTPHFLHGRDALLDAIDDLEHGNVITASEAAKANEAAREGFAKYGMGQNAASVNAAFSGTTSDFNP